MMATKQQTKAWLERFETPSHERLIDEIEVGADAARAVFDAIVPKYTPRPLVEWRGTPWRWTIVMTVEAGSAGGHPIYLIPNPEDPTLGLTLPRTLADSLDLRKAHKPLREPLTGARQVGGYLWLDLPLRDPTVAELCPGLVEALHGPTEE